MFKLNWKNLGIITGLSLFLVITGCGQDDTNNGGEESSTSISEEMGYKITGIEPGAGQSELNEVIIEEYDNLSGWTQELSSTGAMLTELDEAIANEEPILISAWSPHYMFANWDIKFLDDPKGIFDIESVITIAREDLESDMPEAYQVLDRLSWELSDVEQALLEAQEKDFEQVAQEWVEANQETVAEWTEGVDSVDGTSIELVLTPWDSETFTSNVAKIVLEELGFNVRLTPVDPAVVFEAIATGDADASIAMWMPVTHGAFYEEYEGDFVDLGVNIEGARVGLAVPSYLDIDSLEDLEPAE